MNLDNGTDEQEQKEQPELHFVLKETENDKGETVRILAYPFLALGGMPSVGDLVQLQNLYRVYLRRFDYTDLNQLKIYLYVIKVKE